LGVQLPLFVFVKRDGELVPTGGMGHRRSYRVSQAGLKVERMAGGVLRILRRPVPNCYGRGGGF
ncbi:MAG: hypothetical protein KDA55_09990, partial [Planctomycetales bacterium]|nr:hypothetical protein [Planctomycetales bacterium]